MVDLTCLSNILTLTSTGIVVHLVIMGTVSFADVHSLPPELLAQIFCHLVFSLTSRRDEIYSICQQQYFRRIGVPLETICSPYQWLRITEVCHYWRDIALSTSSLWRLIIPSNKIMVDAMLDHSSTQGIFIQARLGGGYKEQLESFNYTVSRTCRVLSLQLVIDAKCLEEIYPSLSKINPNCLTRLSLVHDRHGLVLCNLPNFRFPSLTEFSASGIDAHALRPFLLPSLRSLSIYFVSDMRRYDLPELLSLLEGMHSLEDLTLVNALQATITSPVNELDIIDGRYIVFSHLKSLHLSDYGVTVASFLAHVRLVKPVKLYLRLTAFLCPKEIRLSTDVFRTFVPEVAERSWKGTLKSVLFQSDDADGVLELKAWTGRTPSLSEGLPSQSCYDADLTIVLEVGIGFLAAAREGICSALNSSFKDVESVCLLGMPSDMLRGLDTLSLRRPCLITSNLQ